MDIREAKDNWAYAHKVLAETHPSFKLHTAMPYERLLVGFEEDVNPHNMFGQYFEKAIQVLGERFSEFCFDFYNLEDFYTGPLSFDLAHLPGRENISIKDRSERLERLVIGEGISLVGVEERKIGYVSKKDEDYLYAASEKYGGSTWRLFVRESLDAGIELRGQRIGRDILTNGDVEIFAYDYPEDLEINKADFMMVFSENKEDFLRNMEGELKDLGPKERSKRLSELSDRYDRERLN